MHNAHAQMHTEIIVHSLVSYSHENWVRRKNAQCVAFLQEQAGVEA